MSNLVMSRAGVQLLLPLASKKPQNTTLASIPLLLLLLASLVWVGLTGRVQIETLSGLNVRLDQANGVIVAENVPLVAAIAGQGGAITPTSFLILASETVRPGS